MRRRHWTQRGLFGAGTALVIGYLLVLANFQAAKRRRVAELESGSMIATTERGPIEHAIDGEGPAVLILPGTFGGYDQARLIARHLTVAFTAVSVSRPGYLRTPLDVGRSPAEQADAYAVLLDSLRLDRVAVLGASGGGPSALEFASRYPERTWALVLVAALSQSKDRPPTPLTLRERLLDSAFGNGFLSWWQLARLERSGVQAFAAPIYSEDTRRQFAADGSKRDEFFHLAWTRFPPERRRSGYVNDRHQFGSFAFDDFAAITAPALVVHGTEDRNAPIENGDLAAARIANAEYFRIEGGDHYSTLARPEEVWGRVIAFLQRARK